MKKKVIIIIGIVLCCIVSKCAFGQCPIYKLEARASSTDSIGAIFEIAYEVGDGVEAVEMDNQKGKWVEVYSSIDTIIVLEFQYWPLGAGDATGEYRVVKITRDSVFTNTTIIREVIVPEIIIETVTEYVTKDSIVYQVIQCPIDDRSSPCYGNISFPNVIYPFSLHGNNRLESIPFGEVFNVYDRWGSRLFRGFSWDGRVNSKLVARGSYLVLSEDCEIGFSVTVVY